MHELSIALELLTQLEELAASHGLLRVETVRLEAGTLRGVVPEALELAFREAAAGGVAEEAVLELDVVEAWARCRACGAEFAPGIDDYRCARCGAADAELLAGDDIVLRSVSGEAPGSGSGDDDKGEGDEQDQRGESGPRRQ